MESQEVLTVAEVAFAEPGSVCGQVTLQGWLVGEYGTEKAWLSAAWDTLEDVAVQLAESTKVYEVMCDGGVPLLGGGAIAFATRAIVAGSLTFTNGEYVLSVVDPIIVLQERRIRMSPVEPQLKKKSDS